MQRSTHRLRLSEIGPHVKCVLCLGYLIDATTIVECLHSFCRSCLLNYLSNNNIFCPICDVQIHKTNPLLSIKPDKTLQDIVYKLVPGLFRAEMRRRRLFYAKHPQKSRLASPEERGVGVERVIYSPDDSFSLSLEYYDAEREREERENSSSHSSESGTQDSVSTVEQPPSPLKRFLQCPALVTIAILKKFIRMKYDLTPAHKVEVFHRRVSLANEYTLMDVAYIYTWKGSGPMRFFYRITELPADQSLSSLPCTVTAADAEITSLADISVANCTSKTEVEGTATLQECAAKPGCEESGLPSPTATSLQQVPVSAAKSGQQELAPRVAASADHQEQVLTSSVGLAQQEQTCQTSPAKPQQASKPSTSKTPYDSSKGPVTISQQIQGSKPTSNKAQQQQQISKPATKLLQTSSGKSTALQQQTPAAKPMAPQSHISAGTLHKTPAAKSSVSQQKPLVVKLTTSQQQSSSPSQQTIAGRPSTSAPSTPVGKPSASQQQASVGKPSALQQQASVGKPSATSQQMSVGRPSTTLQQAPAGESLTSQQQAPVGKSSTVQHQMPVNKSSSVQQLTPVGKPTNIQQHSLTTQQHTPVSKPSTSQQQAVGKTSRPQQSPAATKASTLLQQVPSFVPFKQKQQSSAPKAQAAKLKEEIVKLKGLPHRTEVPVQASSAGLQQHTNASKAVPPKSSQQQSSKPIPLKLQQDQFSGACSQQKGADNGNVQMTNSVAAKEGKSGFDSKVNNANTTAAKCSNGNTPKTSGVTDKKIPLDGQDLNALQSGEKSSSSLQQERSDLLANRPSTSGITAQNVKSGTSLAKVTPKTEEDVSKSHVSVGKSSPLDAGKDLKASHSGLCASSEPRTGNLNCVENNSLKPLVNVSSASAKMATSSKAHDKPLERQNSTEGASQCVKSEKDVNNLETGVNRNVLHNVPVKKNPNQQILTKNEEIIKTSIPVKRQAHVNEALKRKFQSTNAANDVGPSNKNKAFVSKKPRLVTKQSAPPAVKFPQTIKTESDSELPSKKVDSQDPGTSRDRPTLNMVSDPASSPSVAQDVVRSEEKVAPSTSPILTKTNDNVGSESKTKLSISKTELTIPVPKTLYNKQTSVDKVVKSSPSVDTKLKTSAEIGKNKVAASNHKVSHSPFMTSNQQVAGGSSSTMNQMMYNHALHQASMLKKTESEKVSSCLPQLIEIPKPSGKKLDPAVKQEVKKEPGQNPKQDGIGALDLTSRPQLKLRPLSLYPSQMSKAPHTFTSASPLSPVGLHPPFSTSPHSLLPIPPHQLRIPNLSRIPSSPSPHRGDSRIQGSPPAKQRRTSSSSDTGKRAKSMSPAERSPEKSNRNEATTSRMPSGTASAAEASRDYRLMASPRRLPSTTEMSPPKSEVDQKNCPGTSRLTTTVDLADSAALRQQLEMQASLWGRVPPHPEWAQNPAHMKQWESIMKSIGLGQIPQMSILPSSNNNNNKKSSR